MKKSYFFKNVSDRNNFVKYVNEYSKEADNKPYINISNLRVDIETADETFFISLNTYYISMGYTL